jgi:hypothetical protein
VSISGVADAAYAWASAGILNQSSADPTSSSPRLPGQPDAHPEGSQDSVTLSPEAKKLDSPSHRLGAKSDGELSEQDRKEVERLKEIDRKVRAHEQAHLAAAAGLAKGPPRFQYVTGPDGKQYAVGGEVSIDTSPVRGDPEATLQKARQVERAATAPSDPSSQDEQVAADAAEMAQEAETDLSGAKSGASGSQISVFA